MKIQKLIIKIPILIFITLAFLLIFSNFKSVQAVDLNFVAGTEQEGGVIIRTFSKAYQGTIEYFDNQNQARGTFLYRDQPNEYAKNGYRYSTNKNNLFYDNSNYVGTSLNYSSSGIQFQKDGIKSAKYIENGGTISYAKQNKKDFIVEEITTQTKIDLSSYTVPNYTTYSLQINSDLTSDKVLRYTADDNKGNKRFRMLKWTVTTDGVAVSDWFIPNSYIQELKKQGYIKDGKVRFSLPTSVMSNCYSQYCDMGFYKNTGDSCKKQSIVDSLVGALQQVTNEMLEKLYGTTVDIERKPILNTDCPCIETVTDPQKNTDANIRKIAYNTKDAYGITVYGEGVSFNQGNNGLRGISNSDKSLANDYDNWLILEPIVDNKIKKNVFIRHVNKETGQLINIKNDKELVEYANGKRIFEKYKNSTNIKPTDAKFTYQEAYQDLDPDDRVTASRSTTLIKNGVRYNYEGVKIGRASDIKTAERYMDELCPFFQNQEISDSSKNDEYITITFYYTPELIESDPPKLYVYNNKSSAANCKTINVSGGDSIKPYIVTPTFTVNNLVYERLFDTSDNNKIKYFVKNFVVKKLDYMSIVNSDGYKFNNYNVSGKIITSKNEKEALFNIASSNGYLKLDYNYKNINDKISNLYNSNKVVDKLSNIDLNSLIGSNTTSNNFTKNYTVMLDAYNGLRYIKGKVRYVEHDLKNGTMDYQNEVEAQNKQFVNVNNEINVSIGQIDSPNVVNHSNQTGTMIQKNATFTLELKNNNNKYLDKYFLLFDFDVNYNNKEYKANTWIEISANKNGNTVFKAIPTSLSSEGDIVHQVENSVLVVGMSNNVPKGYKDVVFKQFTKDKLISIFNSTSTSNIIMHMKYSNNRISVSDVCGNISKLKQNTAKEYTGNVDLYEDYYYFAWTKTKFKTLSRIYDFKVTDCLDVNYKSVFRKNNDKNINSLTGVQYFSGTKELKIYGSSYNVLGNRDLNNSKNKILPLGPYKHADNSYIFAPKLGYRISFDLKTSGYYNYSEKDSGRKILIKPSYYYISKSGTNFNDKINLYYKNAEGKYQKFVDSDYSIYFTPNDGYRYINNLGATDNISNLSKKLTELKISSKDGFYLTPDMMATSDNYFIQSWYGEFKLPNSTIAVKGDNVNNPLTNGYIGVKFEIICIDEAKSSSGNKRIETSYNVNNSKTSKPTNTTQWDYEGYLGFRSPGEEAKDLKLQLEKETWDINNEMYQNIKGTVILYDTDSRAAEDFN